MLLAIAMPPRSLPILLFCLLLPTSTLASAGNFTWNLCSPEPPFQAGVFNVTLTPPQPVAGQTAVLSVSASTDAVPAAGTSRDDFGFAAASIIFHRLPIYSLSRPLCDVIVAAGEQGEDASSGSCPFTGPYELRWEQEFPALTPAGRYHLRLEARESQPETLLPPPRRALSLSSSGGSYGAAGPEILCIEIAFNVVRPASS